MYKYAESNKTLKNWIANIFEQFDPSSAPDTDMDGIKTLQQFLCKQNTKRNLFYTTYPAGHYIVA